MTLLLFCVTLILCVALDISILYALLAGFALFMLYGRRKGFSWRELFIVSFNGVKTVKNVLITFLLIGVLTALWRAAGTISAIVCYSSALIRPSIFLVVTFLLNCAVSVLTGTSFGTSATVGVICAAMGAAMGVDASFTGGAVLSGIYFGDRCSPVSTSALLVAELTGTDIFENIKNMMRSALIPFLVSCALYAALGLLFNFNAGANSLNVRAMFSRELTLNYLALAPAAVILILSALKINVKAAMSASIVTAALLCVFLQGMDLITIIKISFSGFYATDPELGRMLNGGGIISMLRVSCIVCISSAYSGIFERTGILDGAKSAINRLACITSSYAAMLCTSISAGVIACNQTLTVMLTAQLCDNLKLNNLKFANNLEDTAIIVAPLIPWSIAAGVPLDAVSAPNSAILFAFYLYLIPIWRLVHNR